MRRVRSFSALLRRSTVLWCGPAVVDVQSHFDEIFGREVRADADIFFQGAEDNDLLEVATCLGRRRQKFLNAETLHSANFSWEQLLSPGCAARLRKYQEMYEAEIARGETIICDLNQNPGSRGDASSQFLPTFLTHGLLWSLSWQAPLSSKARFAAMGLPVRPFGTGDMAGAEDWLGRTSTLTLRQKTKLSGNSVHAHAHLAWMMYIFAHIQRRPQSMARSRTQNLLAPEGEDSMGNEESEAVFPSEEQPARRKRRKVSAGGAKRAQQHEAGSSSTRPSLMRATSTNWLEM